VVGKLCEKAVINRREKERKKENDKEAKIRDNPKVSLEQESMLMN